jgi:Tol biopolymer transport system component
MTAESRQSRKESFTFTDQITGRKVLQLTNAGERSVHSYYDIPPWSPTTGRIAFSRMPPGAREGDICAMDADGDNLTRVTRSRAMTANDGAMAQWSADGRRIYFRDREGEARLISWANVETGEKGGYPGDLRMVCPTGNRQAYHTTGGDDHEVVRRREEHGVFVQDLNTGASKRVASVADCWRIHPRREEIADWHLFIKHTKWSPGGELLMFVFSNVIPYSRKYGELPHVHDIYVIHADGTGLRRVGEFSNHPLWHPNGREILTNSPFEGRPGNSLVLIDTETGERRLASGCIAGTGHPSFSPDGRYIAVDCVMSREGYGTVNLVDMETDRVECLVQVRVVDHSHAGTHLHPVWSRDGRQILYASDASDVAQLCVINV